MHWVDGIDSWITLTWWAVLILMVILVTRYFVRRNMHPEENTALEILKKRYAKGEIDKEEFERKKKHISD
ncbi:MAG: SHOCT domain-containing protein [Balneolaceae bacterium]|nr:SHOCT domain-containing protein [Balneolaceae bacterium]